jgi:hypothetical protein
MRKGGALWAGEPRCYKVRRLVPSNILRRNNRFRGAAELLPWKRSG